MTRMNSQTPGGLCPWPRWIRRGQIILWTWLLLGWALWPAVSSPAGELGAVARSSAAAPAVAAIETNAAPRFNVRAYAIEDKLLVFTNTLDQAFASYATNLSLQEINARAYAYQDSMLLFTNPLTPLFEKYTGPSVGLDQIVQAAAVLQEQYRQRGYPGVSVSVSEKQIINGIVTLNVFHGLRPQILISGMRYSSSNGVAVAANPPPSPVTNMVSAAAAPSPSVSTNAGPKFEVKTYLIAGNSVLSPQTIKSSVSPHMGTNVAVADIVGAALDLQKAYRNRGYPTVNVTIPQQKITNGLVKLQVFEGRLSDIIVANNRYFSSNNIMRALPSLHTNQILNGPVFQAELNRANANQDRQIYPTIEPGPEENTTLLRLTVKDQLPVHGKVDFNNEATPGTPSFRVNSSAVINNLWQLDHTLGIAYSFAPENYQPQNGWNGSDENMVANFSTFYRLPLGNPPPIADIVASDPGNFGYSEATRQFRLPPPTGQPTLTFFASHATIDTGVTTLSQSTLLQTNNLTIGQRTVQTDLTINNDIGTRLNIPLKSTTDFQSGLSGGFDYKNYSLTSDKTNIFSYTTTSQDQFGNPLPPQTTYSYSPVPTTENTVDYLPLALGYNLAWRAPRATVTFDLGFSGNVWYDSHTSTTSGTNNVNTYGKSSFQSIAGSREANGYWVTLNPSLSVDFEDYTNWTLSMRANGQWADQPLISNEQFGAGGVSSVRGYQEGAVFGDTGLRLSVEQKTPPHTVGMVYGNTPLILRGSVYMDFADAYLLDPQGRPASTALWGTGFGIVGSVGSHWSARFLFSLPLLNAGTTTRYQPFFNFGLTGQF